MGIIATGGQNKMRRRRLVSIVAAAGLATIGALGLHLWRANAPAQHGVLTRESPRETRETFYLKTDEGFDNTHPVKFPIPFELDRLEWHTDGNQTAIAIRFTNPVSPQTLQKAGFCVEIVARRGDDALLLWWGHNISPKLAPELTDAQAIAVDYRTNEAVAWGKASFAGDAVHLRLPIAIDRIDVAYLRYSPSKQASAEGCGMQIASILSGTPPPWGRRVLSVQGGYRWREE
jgi:hypothetical protein